MELAIGDKTYLLNVKAVPTSSVYGTFKILDEFGSSTYGVPGALVDLWHYNGSDWDLVDWDFTLYPDGYFDLTTYYTGYHYLWFWSVGEDFEVIYSTDGDWDCGESSDNWMHYYSETGYVWLTGDDWDVGDWTIPYYEERGAFNIVRWMARGSLWAQTYLYWYGSPTYVFVAWDPSNTSNGTHYMDDCLAQSHVAWEEGYVISLSGDAGPDDQDQWDASVILHEFGHDLVHNYGELADSSSGPHSYVSEEWTGGGIVGEHLAFMEAVPNLLSGCMKNSELYLDRDNNFVDAERWEFEYPDPDVPFYQGTGYPPSTDCAQETTGALFEGAITEALWDIFDSPNDGNQYDGPDIDGHNNDFNSGAYWRAIGAIADVMFGNCDPAPNDAYHNHPWDWYEFVDCWLDEDYPVEGEFHDIVQAHCTPSCTWLMMDANGDGIRSITDVVYMIQAIFNGGPMPIPHPIGSGDSNCDGVFNITDAVYMVNWITGGPGSDCTCEDYY